MAALFGIHVGNTSACLALWKDECRVEIVANDAGHRVTPAWVQWTPDNCILGRSVQLEHYRNETNTIIRNKQLLNDNISDVELQDIKSHVAYKINKFEKGVRYELLYEGKQYHVCPRDILVTILKKIHAIAKAAVGGNKDLNAVICVPLYFPLKSIQLIKDVVSKVGFNVLQVIDEPSSAALGAGLGCKIEEPPYHCLIYRVGGISLDATVVLVQNGMFSVLNTIHKYDMGGAAFTEKLAEFLTNEFKRQYKSAELTERSRHKLYAAAENVKQILSIQTSAQCSAESIGGGYDLNCSVSRARFENMIAPNVSNLMTTARDLVHDTGLSMDKIKKVILCGGSMKIPRLQDALRSVATNAEFITASPDELISVGAAMQAGFCTKYQLFPEELSITAPLLSAAVILRISDGSNDSATSYTIPAYSMLPLKKHYRVTSLTSCVTVCIDLHKKIVVYLGSVELSELKPMSFVSIDLDIHKDGKLLLAVGDEANCKKNYFRCDLDGVCSV